MKDEDGTLQGLPRQPSIIGLFCQAGTKVRMYLLSVSATMPVSSMFSSARTRVLARSRPCANRRSNRSSKAVACAQAENPPDGPRVEYELTRHPCRGHRPRLDQVGRSSSREICMEHGRWNHNGGRERQIHVVVISPDRLAGGRCERKMAPRTRKCCRSRRGAHDSLPSGACASSALAAASGDAQDIQISRALCVWSCAS